MFVDNCAICSEAMMAAQRLHSPARQQPKGSVWLTLCPHTFHTECLIRLSKETRVQPLEDGEFSQRPVYFPKFPSCPLCRLEFDHIVPYLDGWKFKITIHHGASTEFAGSQDHVYVNPVEKIGCPLQGPLKENRICIIPTPAQSVEVNHGVQGQTRGYDQAQNDPQYWGEGSRNYYGEGSGRLCDRSNQRGVGNNFYCCQICTFSLRFRSMLALNLHYEEMHQQN